MPIRYPDDMIGMVFDRLTVIEFSHSESHSGYSRAYWKCKCECGNITLVRTDHLTRRKCRSCGCLRREKRGHRAEDGWLSFNKLYHNYKGSAKKRGLVFELSKDDVFGLMQQNCHYCGLPPSAYYYVRGSNGGCSYNGIDRVDSSIGYTHDNVVPCCGMCNRAKYDVPIDVFLNWLHFVRTGHKSEV